MKISDNKNKWIRPRYSETNYMPLWLNYSFILREVQFWDNFGSPHPTLALAQIKAESLQNLECWYNTKSHHISFDINRAFSANIQQNLTPQQDFNDPLPALIDQHGEAKTTLQMGSQMCHLLSDKKLNESNIETMIFCERRLPKKYNFYDFFDSFFY